jgi:1,4-dihydroxy-2-naphthoate polyprenyltransferase
MAFDAHGFHFLPFAATLICAVLIQIGTNFANDVFDFQKGTDNVGRKGPLRVTQAGLVTPRQMKGATILVLGLAFLISLYLAARAGWPIALVAVSAIACAVLYTGGPWPLGYLGLGDLFVLVFFGPVAVGGTYYIMTGQVTGVVLLAGLALGMIATAILVVNNLRDLETDRKSGKKTLAARFGGKFARAEYAGMVGGAALVPIIIYADQVYAGRGEHVWSILASLYVFPAIPVIRRVFTSTEGGDLNLALAQTAQLLILYGALFGVGWLL